jgi:hypothetical protein
MKQSRMLVTMACCLVLGSAGVALAGAPQPDQRQGDFAHVCQGGPNKALPCTVASEDSDCPKSACVVQALSKSVTGTLTLIAHDAVTDWLNGGNANQALTVLLEVKAPDGSKQMLAATYQDLATPSDPPAAPANVVSIPMDEAALKNLSGALNGLLFVQPQSTLAQQLQALFNSTGTPVLVAVDDKRALSADHSGDGLATVLRFKVKVQFLNPV